MQHRTLGTQGLEAGAIGLGVMGMSVGYGPGGDTARNVATIRRALDLGVTMLAPAELERIHAILPGGAYGARYPAAMMPVWE
jgi:hypothetical protein